MSNCNCGKICFLQINTYIFLKMFTLRQDITNAGSNPKFLWLNFLVFPPVVQSIDVIHKSGWKNAIQPTSKRQHSWKHTYTTIVVNSACYLLGSLFCCHAEGSRFTYATFCTIMRKLQRLTKPSIGVLTNPGRITVTATPLGFR